MGPAPSLLLKVLNLHFSCWQLRKKKKKATCENFILQNCSSYSARRCPRVLPPPHLPAHQAPTGRSCRACPRGLRPTPPASQLRHRVSVYFILLILPPNLQPTQLGACFQSALLPTCSANYAVWPQPSLTSYVLEIFHYTIKLKIS